MDMFKKYHAYCSNILKYLESYTLFLKSSVLQHYVQINSEPLSPDNPPISLILPALFSTDIMAPCQMEIEEEEKAGLLYLKDLKQMG